MTKAEIITLCETLCGDVADAATLDVYYDEVVEDLASRRTYPVVDIELTSTDDFYGGNSVNFPDNAIGIIAAFFNDRHLSFATKEDIGAYDADWDKATVTGTPVAYTQSGVDSRRYKIYPKPSSDSDAFIFSHGQPFGEDYPANAAVTLFTSKRTTNIEDHIALCIAFKTLAREFAYPSDHRDADFAAVCDRVGEMLWSYAGL